MTGGWALSIEYPPRDGRSDYDTAAAKVRELRTEGYQTRLTRRVAPGEPPTWIIWVK